LKVLLTDENRYFPKGGTAMIESVAPPSALKQFLTRHKLFITGYLSGMATALVVYLLARENIQFAAGFFLGFLFCLLALRTLMAKP